MRNYSSFLVRHWLSRASSDEKRQIFDIEHIQSGRRKRIESLTEVQSWIEAISLESPNQDEPESGNEYK